MDVGLLTIFIYFRSCEWEPNKEILCSKGTSSRRSDLVSFFGGSGRLEWHVKGGESKGALPGVGIGGGDLKVLLLQFVDDTIFF